MKKRLKMGFWMKLNSERNQYKIVASVLGLHNSCPILLNFLYSRVDVLSKVGLISVDAFVILLLSEASGYPLDYTKVVVVKTDF